MTGASPAQIVRAWLVAREVFGSSALGKQIETLDSRVADTVQAAMFDGLGNLAERATTWLVHPRRRSQSAPALVERLSPAVALQRALPQAAAPASTQVDAWVAAGVPAELARSVAASDTLVEALDIAETAESAQLPLQLVGAVHRELAASLGLARVQQQIDALPADGYWDTLARSALADELAELQRDLALQVMRQREGDAAAMLQAWEAEQGESLRAARRLLGELAEAKAADLAMLSVALRRLRDTV